MLDLSPKQIRAFQESNSRLNIFEGAVRSGKSFVSLIRFLKAVRDCPEGAGIVVGRTDKTIYRNIVMPLQDLCGDVIKYHSGKGQMELFGRTVFVVGANDDRAEGKIRGSEFAFALVDELTLIPENFIKMLFSRLSIEGAQFFATTNPDSPFHWVRRELLDRRDELDLQVFSFKLDDNPSLSQSYKDALDKEYRGLWHKRFIEGAWVQADGAVFDFFDERTHVIEKPPGPADYYIVGIDYGTLNPCAFSMIGVNESCYPKMWLEKEYYYDGRKTNRQKSDFEYTQDFLSFARGYHVKRIYIDPSAASFRRELQREGVQDIVDADNRVLDGIRFVSNELCSGSFKICQQCTNAIREFQTYVWDEKASNRGEDKPVKENDHCFVAGTKIETIDGPKNIENVLKGELVLTSQGYKPVLDTFQNKAAVISLDLFGKQIECTQSHLFKTFNRGGVVWKEAKNLLKSDLFCVEAVIFEGNTWQSQLGLTELNTGDIQALQTRISDLIFEPTRLSTRKEEDICIETFGCTTTGQFPKDIIYITLTGTQGTTTLATLHAAQLLKDTRGLKRLCHLSKKKLHQLGIEQKKELSFTSNTDVKSGKVLKKKSTNAINAEKSFQKKQLTKKTANFVIINVGLPGEEKLTLTLSKSTALLVVKSLCAADTEDVPVARIPAQPLLDGKKDVYNLHVADCHEYFANGVLVHNCLDSLRYSIYTHFFKNSRANMKSSDAYEMERKWASRPYIN